MLCLFDKVLSCLFLGFHLHNDDYLFRSIEMKRLKPIAAFLVALAHAWRGCLELRNKFESKISGEEGVFIIM